MSYRSIKINGICVRDLELMQTVLNKAKNGVDMNLLAFRSPDRVYFSDSCPAGLGGYIDQGRAWRFKVPEEHLFKASNNLLEFMAAIITPWIDVIEGRLNAGDCALSMTDSMTAEGWMRKSNFDEPEDDPASNSSSRRGKKIRNNFYGCRHQRLQSVVRGKIEQRRGRPLLGLASR